ncbi:hypothetical protein [Streptomyces fagopyri]|uniref:hypothetical protein n=1 Tax=Streptomyces fagopyri TaxID=2662397 RepID=UPI0033ED4B9F
MGDRRRRPAGEHVTDAEYAGPRTGGRRSCRLLPAYALDHHRRWDRDPPADPGPALTGWSAVPGTPSTDGLSLLAP